MNIHKNARLTFARRQELVTDMVERHMSPVAAAAKHGVSAPTARKWLGRFLAQGQPGLRDASSRPRLSPRAIAPQRALAIIELRRRRLTQARIARSLGVSESTVSRVVGRAGLAKLSALEPSEPVVRYEHAVPGELVHIDTKKLGRIVRTGHRITGNPPQRHREYWCRGSLGVDRHHGVSTTNAPVACVLRRPRGGGDPVTLGRRAQ